MIETLTRNGIAALPRLVPNISETVAYLKSQPCYTGHVKVYGDQVPRSFEETRELSEVWCHDLKAILTAPNVLEFALEAATEAEAYLGHPTYLYSLNAFWTRPGASKPHPYIQVFHRDYDDDRFLALFMYGTDVLSEGDGAHLYQIGTHRHEQRGVAMVCGPAGTAFLADTSGLHMGVKPQAGCQDRLIIWARWGVSDPPRSYVQDQLSPVDRRVLGKQYPRDRKLREMVKLIVK